MRPGSEILVGLRGYRGFPGGFKAYRKAFPTVELSWWHRVGDVGTISRLRALAPEGFRFSAVGHKHLTFRPTGEERRVLRRLLRRFRLFGPKAGALRLLLPEDLSPEALEAWLPLPPGPRAPPPGEGVRLLRPGAGLPKPTSWAYTRGGG